MISREWWPKGGRLRGLAILLATLLVFLLAGALLSACGDGADEEDGDEPVPIQEAVALLARPDLSDLTEAEQDLVETALRDALSRAGKVHVRGTLDELDIVFGPGGRVDKMRVFGTAERQPPEVATPEAGQTQTIRVYSGPPTRFCDGREDPELVMVQEYELAFEEWQVSTKAIRPDQVPFGMLLSRIDLSIAEDAGFSEERGRQLRGLSAPFPQPEDPEATVTVWVDLEDGLIRRVETTLPGAGGATYPFAFDYSAPVEIEVPSEPAARDCVSAE
jgi:hypothetical protein